jgi:thymidine phosphorylase
VTVQWGAGRKQVNDVIDPMAGIILYHKVGDYVTCGEPLMDVYNTTTTTQCPTEDAIESDLQQRLLSSLTFSSEETMERNKNPASVVTHKITSADGLEIMLVPNFL